SGYFKTTPCYLKMGLFNIFRKDLKSNKATTDNGVLGPTFLDGLTIHIDNLKDLHSHEWRRQLKSASGQTKFSIKYYGRLHENYSNLIIGTDFAPSLVYAVDASSGQEILLFDGCKHGYNALLCDTFTDEQNNNRQPTNIYKDKDGYDTFEIVISTYNGIDFDDEFSEEVDENGLIEIIDGTKIEFEILKRNAYDTLQIWATNENSKIIDFVSEELA
ncbi:hypothetical protein, partial [Parasediminibacterium sp. JCM 36343]|uniref:hypothetical protein n=1 Tax=Parasediminibacterium sp. JCM 36343 TaxID=3374279 RepID=UPI00397B4122